MENKNSAQILVDLMSAFHRFFKVGFYYPAEHAVSRQAAESFLQALKKVAGGEAGNVRFAVSDMTLVVQGVDLDNSLAPVKYFRDLLHFLHISALDVHRDITAGELRLFLSRLLDLQTARQSSRDFKEAKITGLPSSVKVHQPAFLTNQVGGDISGPAEDSSSPTVNYLLSILARQGLKADEVEVCRQFLDSIPALLQGEKISENDLPPMAWHDVEKLLHSVAQGLESSQSAGVHWQGQDIDALVTILKTLEQEALESRSRHAVNLLIDKLKASQPSAPDAATKKTKTICRNDSSAMSVAELNEALDSLKKRPFANDLLENNRSEQLSIIMQMASHELRLQASMKIQHVLQDCLQEPLTARELRIVVMGTRELLSSPDYERVEASLLMILDVVRHCHYIAPLSFLRDVCQGLMKAEFMRCWPFLVNEALLAGAAADPQLFEEICAIINLLPWREMRDHLYRLEKVTALTEERIASDLFSPPPAQLRHLFLLLLSSSHGSYLSKQLVAGLIHRPFAWLDKAVAPLLDSALPSDQQFVIDLLKENDPAQPSRELRKKGVAIIVERLPTIPAQQRHAPWVAETIAALKKSPSLEMHGVIDTIINQKHYLFFPVWPRLCRLAARDVLNSLM